MPTTRIPCALLIVIGLLACAATGARAAENLATTALEAGPFGRASAVLLVHVTRVTDVRAPGGAMGRQVVQGRVLQTFKGTVLKGADISIIVVGQRPTLDPARPSVPFFRQGKHERYVLFLRRGSGRHAWQFLTLYEAEGRVGAEKVAAVAAVADWAGTPGKDAKARKTLLGLIQMLKSRGRWTRPHAARELAYLAQIRPEVFDRRTRGQLARLAAVAGDQDQRFWLRRVMELLRRHDVARGARQAAAAEGDPWRDAFDAAPGAEDRRLLLSRLLASGGAAFDEHGWWAWIRLEPSSRLWLVEALVLARRKTATARLRARYGSAESAEVREAIVRAVGLLGGGDDVAWLAARLKSSVSRRAALIALARVRTPAALAQLRAARAGRPPDEVRWIDHLLSPAFLEGERR